MIGLVLKMKKWSSQWMQFMQLRKEAWKKFRTSMGFEPVTSWLLVRCSTNWAMKLLMLGAGQLWVHMFPWKKWVLMIYEINHIWTAEMKWKWRNDRRSERNLCNCVKKPEKKNQDFNGVWRASIAHIKILHVRLCARFGRQVHSFISFLMHCWKHFCVGWPKVVLLKQMKLLGQQEKVGPIFIRDLKEVCALCIK